MITPTERLNSIAQALRSGEHNEPVAVRTLLDWFGVQRRGPAIVRHIRNALDASGLVTEPDFEGVYINSEIKFALRPVALSGGSVTTSTATATLSIGDVVETEVGAPLESSGIVDAELSVHLIGGGIQDPTYRIGKLAAANNVPISVTPDSSLAEAITLMLSHDFSQLPVMQNERVVKGIISWQSIGVRIALQCQRQSEDQKVRDFMDKSAVAISADTSLFSAIPAIVERQYVLIRDTDQKITGIVTTSDLSLQFQQLAEPFLLLGEIENHIRRLIGGKLELDEVRSVCEPADENRNVETVDDLTFGEYVRLLENPALWSKIKLNVDRVSFVKQLDRIREIRNDVMHFDPDGVSEDQLNALRKFVKFLQALQELGVT